MTDTASAAPSEREKFETWAQSLGLAHESNDPAAMWTWAAWQAALRAQPTPLDAMDTPEEVLPTIKGAGITGGYVVVTPAGWGDDKAIALRDAILRIFPVNPAFTPKPNNDGATP